MTHRVLRAKALVPMTILRALLPLGVASALAACTLDARGLGEVGALPSDAADSAAVSAEASSADASSSWPGAPEDASRESAPVVVDAAADVDGGDPCDTDGDGHRAIGSVCLGDDCCDTDGRVHPGEKDFFATPSACGSFDYDCDGKESVEFGTVHCQLGFFTCSGDGFSAAAACGVNATFTTCSFAGLSCNTKDESRFERCR